MNARGQVVGTSGDCGGQFEKHGFIWQRGGPMVDLNSFVPRGSHLMITDGESINDRGEIAASGMLPNGDFHAVVLIPCNGGPGCQSPRRLKEPKSSTPAPGSRTTAILPVTGAELGTDLRSPIPSASVATGGRKC
jgi:probable HAF family extracellular repeat protein